MRIEHLQEFVVLCESMNFTRAAKRLYISQPVLSTHISALEKELGVSLLARSRQHVELTSAGAIFLEGASAILERFDATLEAINDERNGVMQELRVGYLHYAYRSLVPTIVEQFGRLAPGASFSLYSNGVREVTKSLVGGNIDVALTIDCDEGLADTCEIVSIGSEPLLLAVSRSSPYAKQKEIPIAQLAEIPLLFPNPRTTGRYAAKVEALFHAEGIKPNVSSVFYDVFSRMTELENGVTASLVMAHFAPLLRESVVTIPIASDRFRIERIVAWRRDNTLPAIAPFVEAVQAVVSA